MICDPQLNGILLNGLHLLRKHVVLLFMSCLFWLSAISPTSAVEFVGTVVDAGAGVPIPARVYLQSAEGEWLFVTSASPDGSALTYREQWAPMPESVEKHTTISAHPFRIDLPPGDYTVTIEHGKEYLPLSREVTIDTSPAHVNFALQRWINMAELDWYSGETHVHRRIHELPNVQLAEDLNVAFPVTFWTTRADRIPDTTPSRLRHRGPSPFGARVDRGSKMIEIDATHVIFPRNTEYEIFFVDDAPHTLGAVSILNHKSVFQSTAPPIGPIAEQAHREGALIDLEKHNWPWSTMLVPVANVDLYELSNNSVWKTAFGFRDSPITPAPYMQVETDARGMTEQGWIQFGLENYYAFLNCGFRLKPTAGTASGVHPVPLGYSRVYVHLENGFSGDAWIEGLRKGNSFVTTGPMLLATVNEQVPGHLFQQPNTAHQDYQVSGRAVHSRPLNRIEVVVNGSVVKTIRPKNTRTPEGAFNSPFDFSVSIGETSWIVVRCFENLSDGRIQFAHSAPWHIEVNNQPIRPRRREVEYLIHRTEREIVRNKHILSTEALDEFSKALRIYEDILDRAEPAN